MAAEGQEKRPSETIPLSANFASVLGTGDSLISGNCDIVVTNALTDAVATPDILDGAIEVSGAVIRGHFKGGNAGDIFVVTFKTGETSALNRYEGTVNLLITDTPAGDNLLTSLDAVKLRLDIAPSDTSDDELITSLVISASRYFLNRVARALLFQKLVEKVYLDKPSRQIRLQQYPVLKIDQIRLISADETDATIVTPATAYDFDADTGDVWLRHSFVFVPRPSFNEITYRLGYPRIPEDVAEATAKIAKLLYRVGQREGLSAEKIGDYMWEAKSLNDLPKHLRAELEDTYIEGVIARYRRRDMTDGESGPETPQFGYD
jgi:hypothetical protein